MSKVRAGHSDFRKAQRHFKKGYWLKSSGSNHMIVMGPDGQPVRRNDGSGRHLGLPSSPRASSIDYHLRRLRDHGVLEQLSPERENRDTAVREILIRDDLTDISIDPSANNEATNQLRRDLVDSGIPKPKTLREYAELADILSEISGEPAWMTNDLSMKLFNGMTLTEPDRQPYIQLLGLLEQEEDPIRARFRLLRKARGLPPLIEVNEDTEQQEETMETINELSTGTGFSVEDIVGNFISDLKDQITMKLDECNKLEDLIKTLEEQYPSIKVEADTTETPREENGGISRTVRVPPAETGHTTVRPRRSRPPAGSFDGEKVYEMIAQGGEWTIQELAAGLDQSTSIITNRLRSLVDAGRVVVVSPASMTSGKGKTAATYGVASAYTK